MPKDQPPPRRSKRKSGGDEAETEILENPAKKKKGDKVPGDTASEFAKSSAKAHHEALSHAAAQASLSQAEYSLENRNADSPQVNKGPSSQTKRRRELNVGGWVSPLFAASVNRSWLEKDSAPKSFDLKTYVPQPGDTLL